MADLARVVKTKLPDGTVVAVEAQLTSADPEADVGIRDVFSFDGVTDTVTSVADALTKALDKVSPDKASVEFGVDVAIESGALSALIVKGSGGATLKITLEWDKAAAAQ